jgi:hypothetical protein
MNDKEIIAALKEEGYVTEGGCNWKAIARAVGENVFYDEYWGIAFTQSYLVKHMHVARAK